MARVLAIKFLSASLFAALLVYVYMVEISVDWSYMGFKKIDSAAYAVFVVVVAASFSVFIPMKFNTRNFMLVLAYFSFFIPSLIVLASTGFDLGYLAALAIAYCLLFSASSIKFQPIKNYQLSRRAFFGLVLFLFALCSLLMIVYGGLATFNLNILRVYEFRREASAGMPSFFGYIFSGVSKVVAPMSLALAIHFKNPILFALSSLGIILLFGMTHHKSVLFLPIFVVVFFLVTRKAQTLHLVFGLFILVGLSSALESLYVAKFSSTHFGYINGLIIRRGLLTPPLLDSLHISFFTGAEKLYWSTSKVGLGLASNPYDVAAPFLIGREFFGRDEMSANAGVIGSGFSHAGYVGVALYSLISGLLLAFLQAYGRLIGHALVSASSLSVFISILTSTDLATAILTHGLLLLIVMLLVFPKRAHDDLCN